MSTLVTRIRAELRGDRAIWAIFAIFSLVSILAVYSSTGMLAYKERGGNTEAYLIKHTIILAAGILLAYAFHLIHYKRFLKWAPYLLLFSVPLLLATIAFAPEVNEARRWIQIPYVGLTFQASDFAKIALIVYVAKTISSKQEYIKDFNSAFLPIIVPILIICGLIAPANLSTAILLFMTCILMMFIGRVSIKYILLLLLLGMCVFSMLILLHDLFPDIIRLETWVSRWKEYMDINSEGGYQARQGKIAIANGGWFGMGPGNSIQRNFLPSSYSDFIYAIICEEYGVLGGSMVIGLYVFLFIRITRLATKGTGATAFGTMLSLGLALLLVVQAFINIGVSVNVLPVTGVTLPMLSMGGTSLLFTCIAFGMILSVSKFIESSDE